MGTSRTPALTRGQFLGLLASAGITGTAGYALNNDAPWLFPHFLMWFAMLAVAICNGALREATFARSMPELRAHQLSTAIGAVAMGVLMWFIIAKWPPASGREAWVIGVLWLSLTVAFEFYMGIVLRKRPWAEVLGAYDLRRGRVWVLFLLWITMAPCLFYSIQKISPKLALP